MRTRFLLPSLVLVLLLLPASARANPLVADWPMNTQAEAGVDPNCPPPTPDNQFPVCKYYRTPDVVNGYNVGPYYRGGIDLTTNGRWGSALAATNKLMLQRQYSDGVPQLGRLTVMAWVRHNGYPGSIQYIVGEGDDGAACGKASWALYTASSGVAFYISPYNQNPVLSPTMTAQQSASLWDGNWHMVAGTYDESKVRLYVDGQQIGDGTSTPYPLVDYYTLSHENLYMDGYYPPECGGGTVGGSHDYTGDLDEVRLYGRALSPTELTRMQTDSGGTQPPVLVPDPPVVHTTGADQITTTSARINGTVDDHGPATPREGVSYHVEYGTTTAYGHASGTFQTDGVGLQTEHVPLSGLSPGATYHARLVAGPANTAGEDITFTTASQATLHFTASSVAVGEGGGSASLTVKRDGDTSQTATVHYSMSDGTAKAGSDYTFASGTITFSPSQLTYTLPVTILDDAVHESDETFTVVLSSPSSNATLVIPSQEQVQITDNDALPTTSIALDPATPPSGGVYKTPVKVTVTGSGHAPVETRCVLDPPQAPAGFDSMPTGCSVSGSTVSAQGTHTVYAASRDSAGTGTLVSRSFTITYDPPVVHTTGADQITNTGARVNGTIDDHGTAVPYHVEYGTSTAYGHSTATFQTAGTGAQTVHVTIGGLNAGTTYHARLVAGTGNQHGEDISFTTTNLPLLRFTSSGVSLGEGQGPATLTVERAGDASQAVTVHYATSDGSAKAGSDYTAASGTLSFSAGQTTKSISVAILDDAPHEPDETLTVSLSSPSSNAALGSPSQAQVQIGDNDALPETAIALDPATPDGGDVYRTPVKVTVTSTGHAPVDTRCVLDPAQAPTGFDDIPAGCGLSGSAVDAPGPHTVYAASRDSAGTSGLASRSFTIAFPTTPDTTIVDAPTGTVWTQKSLFSFSSTVAGSSFECRVDGADFSACSSPFETAALNSGPHSFEVRAIAPDGTADPTPAAASFTVGEPSTTPIGCSLSPVRFDLDGAPVRYACLVGQGTSCPTWIACKWEEHICPVGAECVTMTSGDYSTADQGLDVTLGAAASFKPLDWSSGIVIADASGFCNTGGDTNGCHASATLRALGEGKPLLVWCQAHRGSVTGPVEEHPDQRHIQCAASFEVKLVAPLTTLAAGTNVQVLAPSAGTLTGTATVTGGTGAAAASAASRPRIAGFHRTVHARGPLTVHLHPNRAAKRMLRRRHRLHVVVRLGFTPVGGQTQRRRKKVTLTAPVRKGCPAKRHKRARCLGA